MSIKILFLIVVVIVVLFLIGLFILWKNPMSENRKMYYQEMARRFSPVEDKNEWPCWIAVVILILIGLYIISN
ncbi:MAG TPA: hypothetical protein VJY62_07270 [Bacteroidia bacterium]|nr:hypothetical protein [Bacteroidia bacterium]